MSTSLIASYAFASQQLTIYGGTLIFIAGVLGGLLNTIVFLSLRVFRQSSCAFYLTIMSALNIGFLFFGILPRIITAIYNTDATQTSLFYCKFKSYFSTSCITIALTCFCLATFDQYCATCSRPRFQQWCNIKLAQRLVIIFTIIWVLHATPYLFLFYHSVSPVTGQVSCTMTNTIYIQYRAYVNVLILFGFLPVCIVMLFGCMAYINEHQLAHYTLPIVRRELDKQLTTMVLAQVVAHCFAIIPYTIMYAVQLNTDPNLDPIIKAEIQLIFNITNIISYLYFSVSTS
jgi:hypothetical protein